MHHGAEAGISTSARARLRERCRPTAQIAALLCLLVCYWTLAVGFCGFACRPAAV